MYLTIHRGTHEIGGSCVEITSLNSRIIIDIGTPLVKADGGKFNMADYEDLSGQELVKRKVLPDVQGLYRWDKEGKIADGKKVIYSGDFRNHGRKGKAFYYFLYAAPKNVDALVLEGTMLGRKNEICITERKVEDKIVRIIKGSNKIVLADFSRMGT